MPNQKWQEKTRYTNRNKK